MADLDQLTHHQRQIAVLVAEGKDYKEIGGRLGIAESTVKSHVKRMARRIAAHYPGLSPQNALVCWVREGQRDRQREAGAA